ncbi:MAG: hypothetical protein H6722_32115 [Sandaracinus sp.]|nr:hypothetical protein [Sandaracinus sp.]
MATFDIGGAGFLLRGPAIFGVESPATFAEMLEYGFGIQTGFHAGGTATEKYFCVDEMTMRGPRIASESVRCHFSTRRDGPFRLDARRLLSASRSRAPRRSSPRSP